MQTKAIKLTYLSLAIASLFTIPHSAQAQEAKPAEAAKVDASADDNTQKITVTSRRRAESLIDVPIAVTAISGKELESQNVQNLSDLHGMVPNLSIYAARGSNTTLTAFIRGVGQADPLWGVDPGVGIYVDDVYIARPQGALLDVFDTQRIEVLRGPQGTLYGKNTIGGAIKYVSKPLGTATSGSADLTLGTHGQKNLKGAIGGASDDGVWRARIAAATLNRSGFGVNRLTGADVSNQDTKAIRASFGYFPLNSPFSVNLTADGTDDDSGVRGFQRFNVNKFDAQATPVFDSRYDIASGMPNVNSTHSRGVALNVKYDLDNDWSLKWIAAQRHSDTLTTIDFDGVKQAIVDVIAGYNDKQTTHEVQAVYQGKGGASGVIGVYYFDGYAGGDVHNNFLNAQFGTTHGQVFTKSTALYGDWNMPLTAQWNLGFGLRYTQETKHAVVDNRGYPDATFTTANAVTANFDSSVSADKTSPKLTLGYRADDNTNLYASFSRGFKSGGFNIRANTLAVPASAKPFLDEEMDSYEIGAKLASKDGSVGFNTALFHNKYKNIQLSVFTSFTTATGQPSFFGDFTNAGKAIVNGAEFELFWKPAPGWTVNGNLSYLDTKFDEYIDRNVNVAADKKFTDAPKVQFGLNIENQIKPSFGGTLRTRLAYTHQSKVYSTTDLSEDIAQNGYGLVNAGIIWERDRNWTVSLQASNLTDVSYRTNGYNIASLGILTGYYGPPRMVSAILGYKF